MVRVESSIGSRSIAPDPEPRLVVPTVPTVLPSKVAVGDIQDAARVVDGAAGGVRGCARDHIVFEKYVGKRRLIAGHSAKQDGAAAVR